MHERATDQPKGDPARERRFGAVLRARRAQLKLSLGELASRVGCAKSYLSAIECGHKGPPTDAIVERLQDALSFEDGELIECARWEQTPADVRQDLTQLRQRDRSAQRLAQLLSRSARGGVSLDELYARGELRAMIDGLAPQPVGQDRASHVGDDADASPPPPRSPRGIIATLPMEVPVINKVTAGYPADFTDMGYPAQVADEYIRTPDLSDPDAFAARVVGDSMEPSYFEGDIVVFSPARPITDGMDCFVRLEPDHESTFKRIYFQTDDSGNELIRIQPINNRYPPRTVPREQVAGLYAGVSVTRSIG